jgi:hypothetical protein
MIEMRWYVPVSGDKVLQYRQTVDTTVRAGIWPAEEQLRTANYQWSEWKDVPLIAERDPGYP